MKTRQTFHRGLAFSAFVVTTLLPRQARARACSVASDCPMGFTCESGGVAVDGGPAGTCTSLPCQSNSDCGPGLTCYQPSPGGPGMPVPVTAACARAFADGGTCSACVPQWDIPCITSSDCGPGFTCSPGLTSYACGKDQDASEPPYVTLTSVPCSTVLAALPPLPEPDSGPFSELPAVCEAGTTCTEEQVNQCMAPRTTSCSADSDCPSTWTCGCETNCLGPVVGSDGGCTTVCIAPNSDLIVEVCTVLPVPPDGGSTPASSSSGASGSGEGATASGASLGSAGSSSGHGSCQMGSGTSSGTESTPWTVVMTGILAAARWRPRRRRRTQG